MYRQLGDREREELATLHEHAATISSTYTRAAILGDLNLDVTRMEDSSYYRLPMLRDHLTELENLRFHFIGPHTCRDTRSAPAPALFV